MRANVLIVDDDPGLRRALADRLRFWGYEATEAEDGERALQAARGRQFDLVLLDLSMPGLSGMEVLDRLRAEACEADVVVLTAHGSVEAAVQAVRAGAADFLQKPADFDLLKLVVERSVEKGRLARVNQALTEQLSGSAPLVLGESAAMRALFETAERAARSNSTVLITGESGSGKQVLAEFLHRKSGRAGGPFVYVNCVALSDELVESTLFGHERGAFTGAVAQKPGRLEAAAGGTAFLDEVGDITPRMQTKLLHFLETGEFERVGGTRTLKVDCRLLAATNRNLPAAVSEGKFREDLFYRLNVIELSVPPLRERAGDILPLAEALVRHFASELKRGKLCLASRTAEILREYSWPGNVRQLKNAVERMVVLARTDTLTPDLLPPEIFQPASQPALDTVALGLHEAETEFRRAYIGRALAKTGGNQTEAAKLLGLQRTFLNRLIKELGM